MVGHPTRDDGSYTYIAELHHKNKDLAHERDEALVQLSELLKAAVNAAATIGAIYQWLERVEKAGGATSLEGVAACNAMLKSLRKNADRTNKLVIDPLNTVLQKEKNNV